MNQYVIINNGEPIHMDLVGDAIVKSKAYTARKFGYTICPICDIVVCNDKALHSTGVHERSARHITNLRKTLQKENQESLG